MFSSLEEWPPGFVQYLHLTVKEYLEKPDVWTNLLALTSSSGFNASVSLLRSRLLLLKSVDFLVSRTDVEEIVDLFLQAEDSTGKAQTALLDAIDTTVSLVPFAGYTNGGIHGLSYILYGRNSNDRYLGYGNISVDFSLGFPYPDSLLTFAVRSGLTLFVRDFVRRSPCFKRGYGNISLLDYATWYCSVIGENVVQPSMVAMLFREGLRPNDASCGSTAWCGLLNFLATKTKEDKLPSPWVDICKLFVLYGADLNTGCKVRGQWKSAWEVMESAFQHLPSESLLDLRRTFLDRKGRTTCIDQRRPQIRRYQHTITNRSHNSRRDSKPYLYRRSPSPHSHIGPKLSSSNDHRRTRGNGRHAGRHHRWSNRESDGHINRRHSSREMDTFRPRYQPY